MRKLQNNALPSETAVELSLSSLDYYVALFSMHQSSHLRTHLKAHSEEKLNNYVALFSKEGWQLVARLRSPFEFQYS